MRLSRLTDKLNVKHCPVLFGEGGERTATNWRRSFAPLSSSSFCRRFFASLPTNRLHFSRRHSVFFCLPAMPCRLLVRQTVLFLFHFLRRDYVSRIENSCVRVRKTIGQGGGRRKELILTRTNHANCVGFCAMTKRASAPISMQKRTDAAAKVRR